MQNRGAVNLSEGDQQTRSQEVPDTVHHWLAEFGQEHPS